MGLPLQERTPTIQNLVKMIVTKAFEIKAQRET
uniref:Uncharacterized protein n=1 Tax=Cucumis melo TaxID=3656 RepID=A0A9I9E503_CUCME